MKKMLCLVICLLMLVGNLGMVSAGVSEEDVACMDVQARNLHKLAKVWGFTKYTHLAFITGEKCWDEELLALIPVIRFADENDVNYILYEWFISLGDSGYDHQRDIAFVEMRSDARVATFFLPASPQLLSLWDELREANWMHIMAPASECIATGGSILMVKTDEIYLQSLREMGERHGFSMTVIERDDLDLLQMADTSWINETFLGTQLSAALSEFHSIPVMDRSAAAVSFDSMHMSEFPNESLFADMDYGDDNYRLLGLFRLWNAMEYYFPYRDILDRDWSELLIEHIPMMLEGDDRLSYELTIASLASNLHDAHIWFNRGLGLRHDTLYFMTGRFGRYRAPVHLTEAEGRLVVLGDAGARRTDLMRGDVIVRLDGRDIEEVAADMLQFVPFPNDETALAYLTIYHHVLRSHEQEMSVDIIRDGAEMTVSVSGIATDPPRRQPVRTRGNVYAIFPEHNIGLINPVMLSSRQTIPRIMNELAEMDGLIVDMRQYPGHATMSQLADFLVYERQRHFTYTLPVSFAPGMFFVAGGLYAGGSIYDDSFHYSGDVVVLMDEFTMSWGEAEVMALRNGVNVTVMGNNSLGANGNVRSLPLPGNLGMLFSSVGIYTPEGGQTQRIGLSPDVYVFRTIEGVREGRDELMEAAFEFLLEGR